MTGLYQVLEGCCLCLALSGKGNTTFDHSEGAERRKTFVWIHLLIGLAVVDVDVLFATGKYICCQISEIL